MRNLLRNLLVLLACLAVWSVSAASPEEPAPGPSAGAAQSSAPVRSLGEGQGKNPANAAGDVDAVIATTRQITEQGVLHRGCDFPTLLCHGGKPEICLQEKREQCDMEACIVKHEAKHLEDIAEERIAVCEGRQDGQLAQTPLGKKVLLERSAIKVEQSCLQFMLRQSDGECRRRISERLQRIARFDRGCVQGAENCKSPLFPVNPEEMVSFCSW